MFIEAGLKTSNIYFVEKAYHPTWDYKLQTDETTIWNILYLLKIDDIREARILDMWCCYMASQHKNPSPK